MQSMSLSDKINVGLMIQEGWGRSLAAKAAKTLMNKTGKTLGFWLQWLMSSGADKVAQKFDQKDVEKGGPPLTQQLLKLRQVLPATEGKIEEGLAMSALLAAEVISILYMMYFTSPWGAPSRHQARTTAAGDENEMPVGLGMRMGHLRKFGGSSAVPSDWKPRGSTLGAV
jgi:hypothetical protein